MRFDVNILGLNPKSYFILHPETPPPPPPPPKKKEREEEKTIEINGILQTYPNLREVSELSLSWGGSDELQILLIDSDDWHCSSTCVWVLNIFSICGRDIFYDLNRKGKK